ncbi:hypothetical protein BV90_18360 [Brucella melitensis]|nr:hypothetical protein M798_01960 [Brucella melitensis ADMAS-G1]KDZ98915.1 hypothetical protein BV91_02610 [Brucella melitensis]KEA01890.1 hypothetical protein BV90_18360 [Brucella melitensis]KPJ44158.1 hypothetical protein ACS50_11970 [Brucella melitensis]OCW13435.1 hypothetical protein ABT44_10780 [Brucella melitensis]
MEINALPKTTANPCDMDRQPFAQIEGLKSDTVSDLRSPVLGRSIQILVGRVQPPSADEQSAEGEVGNSHNVAVRHI